MANKFKMLQSPQSCLSAHIELDEIYANISLISAHQSVTGQHSRLYYSYRLSALQTLTIYSVSSSETVRIEHKVETMSVCNLLATKAKLTATTLHWEYKYSPNIQWLPTSL